MSAPPNKRTPRPKRRSRGSEHGPGEAPIVQYAGNPQGLNQNYSVYDLGLPTTLDIQVGLLNGIRSGQIKAVFAREAVGYLGGTALGGAEGYDVVLLLKGHSPPSYAYNWTFFRFPDRDHALFAAEVIAKRNRIPVIDETKEGRAAAPAFAS